MALRAGELCERIALQSKTTTPDGGGGVTETWSTQATVWGRVEPLAGRERVGGQQVEGIVDYQVTIRRRTDVTDKWRAVWGSKTLAIVAVTDPTGRREATALLCREEDGVEGV